METALQEVPVPGNVAIMAFGEKRYAKYVQNKYWYIDKLLQTPVVDFRKRGIDLLPAPFLLTIKGMSPEVAEHIMLSWLDRCSALRPLEFDPVYKIRTKIADVSINHFLPLCENKLKQKIWIFSLD